MLKLLTTFALALGTAAAVHAEATDVSPGGFLITHRLQVRAAPADVWALLGQPARWWNGAHSYSGQAANLSLGLAAGECFCERWDGHSVEHGRVVYAVRDTLRLFAALGPLQPLAVQGVLTFQARPQDGGTTLTVTYRVAGAASAALQNWAAPVDGVIGEQARRLAAVAEGRAP
jgi:uncharacterized protein YndB with AHSA1/START domain